MSEKKTPALSTADKAIGLFEYIKELNKLKHMTVLNVKQYENFLGLEELLRDPENIRVNYRDRAEAGQPEEEESGSRDDILVGVRKPDPEEGPLPPYALREWLVGDWKDHHAKVDHVEYLRRDTIVHPWESSVVVEMQTSEAEPSEAQSSETETSETQPSEAEPSEAQSSETELSGTQASEKQPSEHQLADTEVPAAIPQASANDPVAPVAAPTPEEIELQYHELWEDDAIRPGLYRDWAAKRDAWVERRTIQEHTRALFTHLYQMRIDLERDSETLEIVCANGFLRDTRKPELDHPVLIRRVKVDYDPDRNEVLIRDTGADSELNVELLRELEDVNLDAVGGLRERLLQEDYHPMDRIVMPGFLKELVHGLSSESLFLKEPAHGLSSESLFLTANEPDERTRQRERLVMYLRPCFFVRTRPDGTVKALETIIDHIKATGDIPAPIGEILEGGKIDIPEEPQDETLEERLAAVGGEDPDILLAKEANREQLEIAKRIETGNAVLVQGPPGTGKTHTIANLMGHFLAQGKSVLVTSHTVKALSVLKEKVPSDIQSLCVSLLDDSNQDMERSIDGITTRMSAETSYEIKKEMDSLAVERKDVMDHLARVRRKMYEAIRQECGTIHVNGEEISPSAAAEFVWDHRDDLSCIPGKVGLSDALPLTSAEIRELYRSNEMILPVEEEELTIGLPETEEILTPEDFREQNDLRQSLQEEREQIVEDNGWSADYRSGRSGITVRGDFGTAELRTGGRKRSKAPGNAASSDGGSRAAGAEAGENSRKATENAAAENKKRPADPQDILTPFRDLRAYCEPFREIREWMPEAIAAGRDSVSRDLWEQLLGKITEANRFAADIASTQRGKNVTRNGIPAAGDLDESLRSLKETFRTHGRVSGLTLLMNRSYKEILSCYQINGQPIASAEDCQILLDQRKMKQLREECARLWDGLLAGRGEHAFADLCFESAGYTAFGTGQAAGNAVSGAGQYVEDAVSGSRQYAGNAALGVGQMSARPEQIAAKRLPMIRRLLDWYEKEYASVKEKTSGIGGAAAVKALFGESQYDVPEQTARRHLEVLSHTLPALCDIGIVTIQLNQADQKVEDCSRILTLDGRCGSPEFRCAALLDAIDQEDPDAYAEAYHALKNLRAKSVLSERRQALLTRLEAVAPEWAQAVRTRRGIHGGAVPPADLEDAWKKKQYETVVEEILREPFAGWQDEARRYSQDLRRITAEYAAKSAWYHLLKRTEADIDMKQALNGWKQTVKRIGKGTGRNAAMYKAKARELMVRCQKAVPVWIMTIGRALDSLDLRSNRFDIVIIDEASQSDIASLAILYMGSKLIIVGDDRQVSPMGIGGDLTKINALKQAHIDGRIPNAHLYDTKTSIYDIAATTFQPLMLREHFRCVPEIIGFSNMLSYDNKIRPLRESGSTTVWPAVVNCPVVGGMRDGSHKTNSREAETIVALLRACMAQPEYDGKTFGVISLLGDDQAKMIQQLIFDEIEPREIAARRLLCGNAANFQGDERDIVFLSLVDSNEGDGQLRILNAGADDTYRKRYNVAVSRARDQLWIVHSLNVAEDLKPGDLRKTLIDYAVNPLACGVEEDPEQTASSVEITPFEAAVAEELRGRGYTVEQQRRVGPYVLDMVVVCGKQTVAVECDGETGRTGEAAIREDMERQTILERLGRRFLRIRGSEYYRDPEAAIGRICEALNRYGIRAEEESRYGMKAESRYGIQAESRYDIRTEDAGSRDNADSENMNRENELVARVERLAAEYLGEPVEERFEGMADLTAEAAAGEITEANAVEAAGENTEERAGETAEENAEERAGETAGENTEEHAGENEGENTEEYAGKAAGECKEEYVREAEVKTEAMAEKSAELMEKPDESTEASEDESIVDETIISEAAPDNDVRSGKDVASAADPVIAYLDEKNIMYFDERESGGHLWIIGGRNMISVVKHCWDLGVAFVFDRDGIGGEEAWRSK